MVDFDDDASLSSKGSKGSPPRDWVVTFSGFRTLAVTRRPGEDTDNNGRGDGTDQSRPSASGDDISDSMPLGTCGGKGFMGVLPKGMELHDIGATLKPEDFEDLPSASQALGYLRSHELVPG